MENKQFINAVALQRYFDGRMSAAEMHALERQALDDSFLSEALEGYEQARPGADHQLSILQRQLEERIALNHAEKTYFHFNWQRLSIAAAAGLMFITAGILFWMRMQPINQQAKQHTPTEKSLVPAAAEVLKESNIPPQITDTPPTRIGKAYVSRSVPPIKSPSSTAKMPGVSTGHRPADSTSFEEFVALGSAKSTILPMAETEPADTTASVAALEGKPNRLSERAPTELIQKSKGNKQALPAHHDYTDYLQKNLRRPAAQPNVRGRVRVEFMVNPDGSLSAFGIINGLSDACNAEAIRVIKDGPAWIPAGSGEAERVRVTVRFTRNTPVR